MIKKEVEQITKADRESCHALCREGKARATLRRLSSTVLQQFKTTINSFCILVIY